MQALELIEELEDLELNISKQSGLATVIYIAMTNGSKEEDSERAMSILVDALKESSRRAYNLTSKIYAAAGKENVR